MGVVQRRLSKTFESAFDSEKASGAMLTLCAAASLVLSNSPYGTDYLAFWQTPIGRLSVEHWVNDALMAIFFLLIGLELKRELTKGELSNFKTASLPIFAALGGVCLPAVIHFAFNRGTPTQAGVGIPMATDIAFALGALALLGRRVPVSLKIFLTALAVIDDLAAIIVIAFFYTAQLTALPLVGALAVWFALFALNRFAVKNLFWYLAGGALIWFLMLRSGVHATLAGVMLGFVIPAGARTDDGASAAHRLERFLHKPVAFLILPVFALANTGIVIGGEHFKNLLAPNTLGIMTGLIVGKPLGIYLFSRIAVASGWCRLPSGLNWKHIFGAGLLGGIGFTMSIFITNLAFDGAPEQINRSKLAILLASLTAGLIGCSWLKSFGAPSAADAAPKTINFETTEV